MGWEGVRGGVGLGNTVFRGRDGLIMKVVFTVFLILTFICLGFVRPVSIFSIFFSIFLTHDLRQFTNPYTELTS